MPRQPRYRIPGLPQHVVQRGNNRQLTFHAPQDYAVYKKYLAEALTEQGCLLHAYVLMSNHIHLLVTPTSENSLPTLLQAIGRRYVRYINRAYKRTGTLWEGRYKASLVQADRYLLACYRYIELNPVRAGMVISPAHYPYSSYPANALGITDTLVSTHPAYDALGAHASRRRKAYRQLFRAPDKEHVITDIRTLTNSCLVMGTDDFKDGIEAMTARRIRPGRPGRPRKIAV